MLRSEHAAGRLAWAPGLERSFSTASASEAPGVWAASQPWVDHDPTAHKASRRAEERLAIGYPQLIVHYQQAIAEGMAPDDAMARATVALLAVDVNGAAAARALAGDERGDAQYGAATPHVATTVSIDEQTQGVHAGAARGGVSDAGHARAALLAARAYPLPLQATLGRGTSTGWGRTGPVREVHGRRDR